MSDSAATAKSWYDPAYTVIFFNQHFIYDSTVHSTGTISARKKENKKGESKRSLGLPHPLDLFRLEKLHAITELSRHGVEIPDLILVLSLRGKPARLPRTYLTQRYQRCTVVRAVCPGLLQSLSFSFALFLQVFVVYARLWIWFRAQTAQKVGHGGFSLWFVKPLDTKPGKGKWMFYSQIQTMVYVQEKWILFQRSWCHQLQPFQALDYGYEDD